MDLLRLHARLYFVRQATGTSVERLAGNPKQRGHFVREFSQVGRENCPFWIVDWKLRTEIAPNQGLGRFSRLFLR
jgi:hypothetical protein